jgi:hypothetical protein
VADPSRNPPDGFGCAWQSRPHPPVGLTGISYVWGDASTAAAQRWQTRGAIIAAGGSAPVPLLAVGFKASRAVAVTGVIGLALTGPGTGRG